MTIFWGVLAWVASSGFGLALFLGLFWVDSPEAGKHR